MEVKNMNNENVEVVNQKETLKEKINRKREEIAAKREAKKAERAENPKKINVKKIGAGLGIATLVIGSVAAGMAASKRCGSDEVYDSDWECEPGDEFEETDHEDSVEEVNEEE